MDVSHEMFTSRGNSVRVCCECRRLRWGAEEYRRFEAATSTETCAQCGRDSCPRCSSRAPLGAPAAQGRLVAERVAVELWYATPVSSSWGGASEEERGYYLAMAQVVINMHHQFPPSWWEGA